MYENGTKLYWLDFIKLFSIVILISLKSKLVALSLKDRLNIINTQKKNVSERFSSYKNDPKW